MATLRRMRERIGASILGWVAAAAGWIGIWLTIATLPGRAEQQTLFVLAAFAVAFVVVAIAASFVARGAASARWIMLAVIVPALALNQTSHGLILLLPGSWLAAIATAVAFVSARGDVERVPPHPKD